MRIVDGTGYLREFNESPTLATYGSDTSERVSQILGTVDRLVIAGDDDLTIFDFDTITVKGGTLRAFGAGTIYATAGVVYAHDNVRVIAFGEAKVVAYGQVSVTASDKVTVFAYERSRVTLRSFATGTLHDYCQGSFHNFSRADLHDQAGGYGYDMCEVEVHGDHATFRGRGNTRAQVHGTPSVWLAGNATAHTSPETRTDFIVATGSSRVLPDPITHASDVSLVPSTTPTVGYQNGGSPAADRATVATLPHSVMEPAGSAPELRDHEGNTTSAVAGSPVDGESVTPEAGSQVAIPVADFGPEWRVLREFKS